MKFGDDRFLILGFQDVEDLGKRGIGCKHRSARGGLVPYMDDGGVCGTIGVEQGFDCRSSGVDIDGLELSIGISGHQYMLIRQMTRLTRSGHQ